jgi:hypothetical protein
MSFGKGTTSEAAENSVLHLILGGAAVHRCGKYTVLNTALAVYDEIGVVKTHVGVGVRVLGLRLILLFPYPESFAVAVASADQGSCSNRWVGNGPTSHVFDPVVLRDHD